MLKLDSVGKVNVCKCRVIPGEICPGVLTSDASVNNLTDLHGFLSLMKVLHIFKFGFYSKFYVLVTVLFELRYVSLKSDFIAVNNECQVILTVASVIMVQNYGFLLK